MPADVVVHVEPRAPPGRGLFETIHAIAQRHGLAIHELSAHQLEGRLFVELHLEVDERVEPERSARARPRELEEEIRAATDAEALGEHSHRAAGRAHSAGRGDERSWRAVQDFLNSLPSRLSRS